MTATLDTPQQASGKQPGTGRVASVIGPVVDVEFAPEELPEIFNALTLERTSQQVKFLYFRAPCFFLCHLFLVSLCARLLKPARRSRSLSL